MEFSDPPPLLKKKWAPFFSKIIFKNIYVVLQGNSQFQALPIQKKTYLFLQKYKVETAFFLNEIKTMVSFFFFNFLFYQNNNNNFFLTKKSVSFNFVSLNTM